MRIPSMYWSTSSPSSNAVLLSETKRMGLGGLSPLRSITVPEATPWEVTPQEGDPACDVPALSHSVFVWAATPEPDLGISWCCGGSRRLLIRTTLRPGLP